ncbi:MAG: hypothetical protein QXK20_03160, partial [Nitrososphaerales archaeon]
DLPICFSLSITLDATLSSHVPRPIFMLNPLTPTLLLNIRLSPHYLHNITELDESFCFSSVF